MIHRITKVVVNAIEAPLLKPGEHEFPSLAAASAFIRTYQPKTEQEVPVKVRATIHWDDGTSVRGDYTLNSDPLCLTNPRWAVYNKLAFFAGIRKPEKMTDEQYRINMELNAEDGNVEERNRACLRWLAEYDLELGIGHKLEAEELADLSEEWENPTVDTSKYYQSVGAAWQVTKFIYEKYKALGGLCQKVDPPSFEKGASSKYYIA